MTSVIDAPGALPPAPAGSYVTGAARSPAPGPIGRQLPPRAHPTAVLAGIGAGAVAVVALWWSDTPSISGLGDWLTNAGRITGLLAGYTIVILLALMARIPAFERGIGGDRLARWHSMGGRYTVSLVVAHGLLITWGYAVTDHENVVHQGWTLLRSYPDVLMATVAGLLLVGVGISSARAARRRLRYETWHFLHFYTYLAVALAFSHQFATGAEFMHNTAARVAWSALYVSIAALLVWYRFVVPVRQALRHQLKVVTVTAESPTAVSILIAGRHLDELQVEPGQYFRWRFLSRDLWWTANPYSLSAPVHPQLMRITAKNLGEHSAALARLRPGTRVYAEGPYGSFTARRRRQRRVLLIGAGVGITPLRTLFETIPVAGPGELTMLYRARRAEDVLFRDELEAIARSRQARLHILTGSRAELGMDPLSARSLATLPALTEHDVYVCGPAEMQASVRAALRSLGVPRRRIHAEDFAF